MTDEQRFHKWLKSQLEPCDYQRLENIGSGMPDVNVAAGDAGEELWLELKIFTAGKILLRKEQYAWGMRAWVYGRKVFIVAQHQTGDIFIAKYPDVQIEPCGKYLQVLGPSLKKVDRAQVKSFLFQ